MEYESVLKLQNVYFEKIVFERNEKVPEKFSPQFATEYKELGETVFEVKIKCRIMSDEKQILEIILVGVFDNEEPDLALRKEINEENTVSILFPYLRAEIAILTSQPNFPTLNLPVMNINAMLHDLKNEV